MQFFYPYNPGILKILIQTYDFINVTTLEHSDEEKQVTKLGLRNQCHSFSLALRRGAGGEVNMIDFSHHKC
jgi:hypothetical protein